MKRILAVLLMLVLAATMCTAIAEEKTYVIGMSQCNLGEPWRVAMNDQIAAAAKDSRNKRKDKNQCKIAFHSHPPIFVCARSICRCKKNMLLETGIP